MLLTQEIWLTETMCFLLSLLNALACGTTAMLHTCLSIDRWMAVAFPITYRNINPNIPPKLMYMRQIECIKLSLQNFVQRRQQSIRLKASLANGSDFSHDVSCGMVFDLVVVAAKRIAEAMVSARSLLYQLLPNS